MILKYISHRDEDAGDNDATLAKLAVAMLYFHQRCTGVHAKRENGKNVLENCPKLVDRCCPKYDNFSNRQILRLKY